MTSSTPASITPPTAAGATAPTLDSLLKEVEDHVLFLRSRLYFLEAFVEELDRVTRGKPFVIWNDTVWTMVLDHRDALVVHLAGLAKSMYSKGGLFGQVRAHCLHEFGPRRHWASDAKHDWERRRLDTDHAAAFARLFPQACGRKLRPSDIDALRDSFEAVVRQVVADRDGNRAHPFEKQRQGTAQMLAMHELAKVFDGVQDMLNDMRLVSSGSTLDYHDMSAVRCEDTAATIVDLVLMNAMVRLQMMPRGLDRSAVYDRMHELHDRLGAGGDKLFNSLRREHFRWLGRLCGPASLNAHRPRYHEPINRASWPSVARRRSGKPPPTLDSCFGCVLEHPKQRDWVSVYVIG